MTRELWTDHSASAYGHGCDGRGGGWPGLRQVVCIRTTREAVRPGLPDIVENHYYLTSLPPGTPRGKPEALLALARSHWGIENCLHHVKDRSLAEDADRTRRGAVMMSWLRSIAVGLLKHIPGASAPQKMSDVQASPGIVLKLLKRKNLRNLPVRL